MTDSRDEILFEKFRILSCYKKDQYSGVYLADHIYLGKKIILKTLDTNLLSNSPVVDRFKREARILASLDHPNIIKVLDFGVSGRYFYISFEYFPGENLREVLNGRKLSASEKKELLVQLLRALDAAHKSGIIHRDIKPENILTNEKLSLKISDFGLAFSATENFSTTQSSAFVGTPSYMAPEQISGDRISYQTDLFSAGIIIYELFTGKNLFLGDDVNRTVNNIISMDEDEIAQKAAELPEPFNRIAGEFLKKERDERNLTAGEALSLIVPGEELPEYRVPEDQAEAPPEESKIKRKTFPLYYLVVPLIIVVLASYWYFASESSDIPATKKEVATDTLRDDPFRDVKMSENVYLSDAGDNKGTEDGEPRNAPGEEEQQPVKQAESENNTPDDKIEDKTVSSTDQTAGDIPAAATGGLMVKCPQDANIYIEGEKKAELPLNEPLTFSGGEYNLAVFNEDYPEYRETITITPGELTTISVDLDTLYGYFFCNALPWAEVYIDNEFIGHTPVSDPLKLEPGNYSVKLKNPFYTDFLKDVTITRNDTVKINYNFEK